MIFTETLDRCPVCPSVWTTPRTLCVPVICNRLQIMQSGSMTLLTTINIVPGAFGGKWPLLGGKFPLSGLYATLVIGLTYTAKDVLRNIPANSKDVYIAQCIRSAEREKPKFHLLRHVTTSNDTTSMTCRASCDVTCRACCAVLVVKWYRVLLLFISAHKRN